MKLREAGTFLYVVAMRAKDAQLPPCGLRTENHAREGETVRKQESQRAREHERECE